MAAPIVYRWDDGNAPVARGERRSLHDILYACLVTGYGSKPGAGWTRESVSADFTTASFRNNPLTGTGFFFQVDGGGGPQAYQPSVRGYEVMVDHTTTGATGYIFGANPKISDAANTTARPWILIADDRAFYFVVWHDRAAAIPPLSNTLVNQIFFGDLVKFYPDDAYACGMAVSQYNSGALGMLFMPSNNNTQAWNIIYTPRRANGSGSSGGGVLNPGGGPGPGDGQVMGSNGIPYDGSRLVYARPHLINNTTYSIRGWLPGLYYPCHPYAYFSQFQQLQADGKTFINIAHNMGLGNTYYYGSYFIQLEDWRA